MNEIIFVDPYQSKETLDIFRTILPKDFNEDTNTFSMIGACDEDGIMLGVLGFDDLGEQCNILWLFVEPFARRMGVASALTEELIRYYCDKNDVKPIAIRYEKEMGDDSIYKFFEANPYFDVREEYQNYSARVEDIIGLDKLIKYKNLVHVEHFFELSSARQQVFLQEMREEGYFDVRNFEEWSKSCVNELCLCTVEEFTVKSAILINKTRENEYEIAFVYSMNPMHLYSIIREAIMTIVKLDPHAVVSASIMNEVAGQIFHKFFTKVATSRPILTAEWNYEFSDFSSIWDLDDEMDDHEVVELW